MIERFADPERGGFFTTSNDHEELIARRKDVDDHPIPSGNSAAAYGLLRLAALTGERDYERQAESGLPALRPVAATATRDAFAHLLRAIDFHLSAVREVALAPATATCAPLAASSARAAPAPRPRRRRRGRRSARSCCGRARRRRRAAAYVCEHFACQAPVATEALARARRAALTGPPHLRPGATSDAPRGGSASASSGDLFLRRSPTSPSRPIELRRGRRQSMRRRASVGHGTVQRARGAFVGFARRPASADRGSRARHGPGRRRRDRREPRRRDATAL